MPVCEGLLSGSVWFRGTGGKKASGDSCTDHVPQEEVLSPAGLSLSPGALGTKRKWLCQNMCIGSKPPTTSDSHISTRNSFKNDLVLLCS